MDRGAWQATVYGVTKSQTQEVKTSFFFNNKSINYFDNMNEIFSQCFSLSFISTFSFFLVLVSSCLQVRIQQTVIKLSLKIGKGVRQGCILSPCLFYLHAEYIMGNAGLEGTQAGIKFARRNINNLRYADDTTLMAESEEELKSLLMKMKEESEKVGLKLNIQKIKIMASGPITSWEIEGETVETVADFILGGSKITADGDCSHESKRRLLLEGKL